MLACCVIISLTSLSTDGFVNKLLKRCALMQTEVAAKLRTKPLTEPCLLLWKDGLGVNLGGRAVLGTHTRRF